MRRRQLEGCGAACWPGAGVTDAAGAAQRVCQAWVERCCPQRQPRRRQRCPRRSGLPAPIAQSRSRPSEADARGSRARDALDGHEEGASLLINDRAHVMVGGVPQELLRAHLLHQYEPSWNAEKAEVGSGALGPDTTGLQLETARQPARACKNIPVHNLDRLGGLQNQRRVRRRRIAAVGRFGQGRERGLRHCGSTTRRCASRKKQASERAGEPAGGLGLFLGLKEVRVDRGRGGKRDGVGQTRVWRG